MLLYETPDWCIEYWKAENTLVTRWKGFSSLDIYKEGIHQTLYFLKDKKASAWLIDTSAHRGVEPEGQKYAAEKLMEYMQENGPVHQAVVVAKDVFGRLSVKSFFNYLKNDSSQHEFFEQETHAKLWLNELI